MEPERRGHAARLGGLLSHPLRLAILERLVDGPLIVSDLIEALGKPQPVISKHLAILREAGLLDCEADGRCRIYRPASTETIRGVLSALEALAITTGPGAAAV